MVVDLKGKHRPSEEELTERILIKLESFEALARDRDVYDEFCGVTATARNYLAPLDSQFEKGVYEHYWYTFMRKGRVAVGMHAVPLTTEQVGQANTMLYEFIGDVVMKVNNYPPQGPKPIPTNSSLVSTSR